MKAKTKPRSKAKAISPTKIKAKAGPAPKNKAKPKPSRAQGKSPRKKESTRNFFVAKPVEAQYLFAQRIRNVTPLEQQAAHRRPAERSGGGLFAQWL